MKMPQIQFFDVALVPLGVSSSSGARGCGRLRRPWKNSTYSPTRSLTLDSFFFNEPLVSGRHSSWCSYVSLQLLLEECTYTFPATRRENMDIISTSPSYPAGGALLAQCLPRQWIHVPCQLLGAFGRFDTRRLIPVLLSLMFSQTMLQLPCLPELVAFVFASDRHLIVVQASPEESRHTEF